MTRPPTYSPGLPGVGFCLPLAALALAEHATPHYPGSALRLDCRALPYHCTQGVCHQVSQLLRLRRSGFAISLHQAHPVLRRCLLLLQVAHLFTWVA